MTDLNQLVQDMVADQPDVVTPDVRGRAIELALIQYSADCPAETVTTVTWPARGVFGAVPDAWSDGMAVRTAEWRFGNGPRMPVFVAAYRLPGGGWGLESSVFLPAGALVYLSITGGPLQMDAIPAVHRRAVAAWTAYELCQQLATRYSGERETTILGADMARTESRAKSYALRAKEWRAAYYSGIGQVDPALRELPVNGPAFAVGHWPKRNPRHDLTRW